MIRRYVSPIRKFFAPAPHVPRLPEDEVRRRYPGYRWRIMESTYLGYAMFYLVRNNLSPVQKDMHDSLGYSESMIGTIIMATALSYGVGKFLMGSLSDRSDPRKFMAFGLMATAVVNCCFGFVANYYVHLFLWTLNGLFQGMGWPPCGRSIGHWYSLNERGTIFSVWNTATNVGGGLAGIVAAWAAGQWGWRGAFWFPAAIAAVGSVYLFWRLRDTPQSVGLPPIEDYRDDHPQDPSLIGAHEKELTAKELFIDNILKNRTLWLFAFANFFVYVVRYVMLDWVPYYLRDVKGADLDGGGFAVFVLEYGGIPSTLLTGWFSDKIGGRRGLVSFLCMFPILAAVVAIRLNPAGNLWFDMLMLGVIGFFVYPPVMLLALAALDLTSKKAVGTAAGFVGLFGYLGRAAQGQGFGWMKQYFGELYGPVAGWNMVLDSVLVCTLAAILLLAFTRNVRPRA
ncbi:MAG: MFS transporter [Sedimentisphaerales bacterium]|nr:MFS transporter [Sedimentisphaerales bacterium]